MKEFLNEMNYIFEMKQKMFAFHAKGNSHILLSFSHSPLKSGESEDPCFQKQNKLS